MDEWGFLGNCRYLIHDRDTKYCQSFRNIIESGDVKTLPLPARSPNLNALKKELDEGYGGDGYGKRYLLGPLYMLMGDIDGALVSFDWYEAAYPDDGGEPYQYLTWALALFRGSRRSIWGTRPFLVGSSSASCSNPAINKPHKFFDHTSKGM